MDMNELQNAAIEVQKAAIEAATNHIKNQREDNQRVKIKMYCLTAIACVLIVCAATVACFTIAAQQETIREQQYALNMQYAGLLDYVAGAEITTTTAEADGDGSISVAGNGNITAGGDVSGQ